MERLRQFYRRFPAKTRALIMIEGGLRPFVDAAGMEKFIAPLRGDNYEKAAGKFIASMTQPIKDEKLRDRIKSLMLRTPQYVAVSEFEGTAGPVLDYQIWENVSHFVMMEKPREFNEALVNFLEKNRLLSESS